MDTTKLSDTKLAALSAAHPTLPSEYFAYLRDVGWGEAVSGRMIYSGPVAPQDVYGATFKATASAMTAPHQLTVRPHRAAIGRPGPLTKVSGTMSGPNNSFKPNPLRGSA